VWLIFWLAGRAVLAQEAAVLKTAAPPPPTEATPAPLDVSINWRSRVEDWNWFEGHTGNSDYAFGHSQLRLGLGQKRRRVDWMVEGEVVAIVGLPNDAVAPAPLGQLGLGATYYAANDNSSNDASAFLKQAYVQLKQLGQSSLKLGRFEFFDAVEAKSPDATVTTLVQTRIAHRLISNFGFSAVQRSFDGAQFAWNAGSTNVTAFAARPTEGVFQVDGMGELDVQIYYGAYSTSVTTTNGAGSLRVFGVGYVDGRTTVLKTDNRSTAARTADQERIAIGTWGADYVHVLHTHDAGTFDMLAWGAFQTGAWGTLTQRAGVYVGEAGWQAPMSRLAPWISAGYSYGSGDSDPKDSQHGTFFQLLPTPRQYARFPFYNMMNNEDSSPMSIRRQQRPARVRGSDRSLLEPPSIRCSRSLVPKALVPGALVRGSSGVRPWCRVPTSALPAHRERKDRGTGAGRQGPLRCAKVKNAHVMARSLMRGRFSRSSQQQTLAVPFAMRCPGFSGHVSAYDCCKVSREKQQMRLRSTLNRRGGTVCERSDGERS
jgi:hypothetical protein